MLIFEGRNRVTQAYHYPQHWGIDIVGDHSRKVRSVSSGRVEQIFRWDGHTKTGTQSYGNLVIVNDGQGRLLYYAHLDSISVREKEKLSPGDEIGIMGNTGNSFGAHTHFEVRSLSRRQHYDPAAYLGILNRCGTYTEKQEGWIETKPYWYWYEGGKPVRNAWRKVDGWWYHFGADGKMETGLIDYQGGTCYLMERRQNRKGKIIPKGAAVITNNKGEVIFE